MGDPHPDCHPRFPDEDNAYGFSCSSFVHQCYIEIGHLLVDLDSMPLATAREIEELGRWFRDNVQRTPFRRLYAGYLIGAFCTDSYPFRPDDWDPWKNHGRFIPALDYRLMRCGFC